MDIITIIIVIIDIVTVITTAITIIIIIIYARDDIHRSVMKICYHESRTFIFFLFRINGPLQAFYFSRVQLSFDRSGSRIGSKYLHSPVIIYKPETCLRLLL